MSARSAAGHVDAHGVASMAGTRAMPTNRGSNDPPYGMPNLDCLIPHGDGVLLRLSVMPNAKRTEIDGLRDGALRLRLAAPPIDGRANEALVAWLAKTLGVARRDVELLRGESSRRKQVAIAVSFDVASRWLADVLKTSD